jgi:hypothetical protein
MRNIKIVGATLTGAFVMSLLASAAAYAHAPEFLNSGGGPATGTTFKGTSGAAKIEGVQIVECTSSELAGEITGAKSVGKVKILLKGCASGTKKCKSPGKPSGEIETVSLRGELEEVTRFASGVGLLLKPESGTVYTTIEGCVLTTLKVTGSLLGEVVKPGGELVFTRSNESWLEASYKVTYSQSVEVP